MDFYFLSYNLCEQDEGRLGKRWDDSVVLEGVVFVLTRCESLNLGIDRAMWCIIILLVLKSLRISTPLPPLTRVEEIDTINDIIRKYHQYKNM